MDVSLVLDRPAVLAGEAATLHLLVRIETWPEEGGPGRKPLCLALVLDHSSSMAGEKLAATIEAAGRLVDRLSAEDRICVVAYADEARVLVPPTQVVDRERIRARLREVEAGGSTNLSAGWSLGATLLLDGAPAGALRRVLLLTDGLANVGVTEKDDLVEIARQFLQEGVVTTCLGFGDDFNEDHLVAIAQAGGGRFHYLRTTDEVSAAFLGEFGELSRVFGQNLVVALTLAEAADGLELLGDLPSEAGPRSLSVRLGDVLDRDRRTVLVSFSLSPGLPPGELEVASAEVRYVAVRGKVGIRRHVLPVRVRLLPAGATPPAPDGEVVREVVRHEVSRAKAEASLHLSAGRGDLAREALLRARDLASQHGDADPEGLGRELDAISRLLDGLDDADVARKELAQQASDLAASRGQYSQAPQVWRQTWTLVPPCAHEADYLMEEARTALESFGHETEFVGNAVQVLGELVENAIEHGCRGAAAARVEVEALANRNFFKCIVEDNGRGFDVTRTLAAEEARPPAEPRARGRGLLLVKRLADLLEFSPAGNRVSAMLRKARFRIGQEDLAVIDATGVEPVALVSVKGQLDSHTFGELEKRLDMLLEERGVRRFIIDLEECDYISSSGMGVLIGFSPAVLEAGGRLILVASGHARSAMEVLGLSHVFEFAATTEEARRLLGA